MKYELIEKLQPEVLKILTDAGVDLSNLDSAIVNSIPHRIACLVEAKIFDEVNRHRKIDVYEKYKAIRKNYHSDGNWTLQQLADRENVSVTVITSVVKGTYWID